MNICFQNKSQFRTFFAYEKWSPQNGVGERFRGGIGTGDGAISSSRCTGGCVTSKQRHLLRAASRCAAGERRYEVEELVESGVKISQAWREMAMSCGDTGCLASVNQTTPCLLPCLWGARSPLACQSLLHFAPCSACVAVPPPWPGGTDKGRRCGHAGRAAGSIRPMPSTKA